LPPSSPSLKRPAEPLQPSTKNMCTQHAASPVASAHVAVYENIASPPSPALSQAQSHLAHSAGDDDAAAALVAAYECLRDTNKAREGAALATLLESLGVTSASDLAFVDDAATLSIKQLLKPTAANFFTIAIGHAIGPHQIKNV
jgi:hypothetical protein